MTTRLYYLGPQGTFTHQAAIAAASELRRHMPEESFDLVACANIGDVFAGAQRGEFGVVAWENNVEGVVVPNLDALLDSADMAGVARVDVHVTFDAFVTTDTAHRYGESAERILRHCSSVTAHPHGLAQCRTFTKRYGLEPVQATSNAAGCQNLASESVALAPSLCGDLYGLHTVARAVQDFDGARTSFLVLTNRAHAVQFMDEYRTQDAGGYESIIGFVPLATGPGVLADLLNKFRDAGLNMVSLMSRPIKGHDGTYSFIATIDQAPWQVQCRHVLERVMGHGDWVKTLAVYPHHTQVYPPVTDWMLPQGGICTQMEPQATRHNMQGELLW